MKNLARKLALTGAFSALVVVLGITRLGFIPLGTASLTILHIPVILIVMISGLPEGVFVGTAFGIFSLIQAAMSSSGGLDPLFVNPMCSVVPRILLAVAAWGIWKLFNLIPKMPKAVSAGITAFIATVIHTALVIGSLYLFQLSGMKEAMGGMGYGALMLLLLPQACMEAAAATIVCVAVYGALYVANGKKSKLSSEE